MYTPVVGLEIHIQGNTKTKMFCRCLTDYFNKAPNINVCPVCFGLPGALPVPNEVALEKIIKLGRALNCSINKKSKFDRKNYFYPDLGKGYQISQYDIPVCYDGFLEFDIEDDSRRIRIERIHLEEDTAKSLHSDAGETLIDFNKAGVPLFEIVTKPDFTTVKEVTFFAKRLRQVLRYIDVSGAEMQKGQIRYELNISVKKPGETSLPNYKVEVKNIGSISVLEKVFNYEFNRQVALHEKNEVIHSQTRGLKDMSGETVLQRSKETSDDYRYFPEPDIPPFEIPQSLIDSIDKSQPELPVERKNRYLNINLSSEQAEILVEDIQRGNFFDEVLLGINTSDFKLIKLAVNIVNSDLAGLLDKNKKDFSNSPVNVKDVVYLINLIGDNKITGIILKKILETSFAEDRTVGDIVDKDNLMQIDNNEDLNSLVDQVIANNQKVVDNVSKNPNAIKFLVGQVMRLSNGKANPKKVEDLFLEKIKN